MAETRRDRATLVILKRPSRLIILNAVALISYLLVSWASGSARHVFSEVFSRPDSLEYRAVADWIYGARASADASAWRPFLYPLLLGLAQRVGGILGIWFLNVVLWLITLNVAAAATYRFVKSRWAAAIVFLVLATNASLIVLTFKALTEITTVALLAIWIYGISHLTRRPTRSQVTWALLPLALLVVVKPEFELLLIVVAVVLIVLIWKSPARGLAAVGLLQRVLRVVECRRVDASRVLPVAPRGCHWAKPHHNGGTGQDRLA